MTLNRKIVYVTSSDYKIEENKTFQKVCMLKNGDLVSNHFEFEYRRVSISEILEVDLRVMVQAEVTKAYSQIKVPCIVEHAGLIFKEYASRSYPGGLTKPMWNTLEEKFIEETNSANREVIARAVVAYCDGKGVQTFVGETEGILAENPKGHRKFYWDTVFIPNDPMTNGKTYAEIIDDVNFGIEYKIKNLSQSSKAMLNFLNHLLEQPNSDLWC